MALKRINNLVTYYKVIGEGKPLMFLHGWGASSKSFSELARLLSRRRKVIMLDLPGFGQTDTPLEPWDVEKYGEFVLAFSKELDLETFALAGHSFGGRIAIYLGATSPQYVERLILMATAGIKHEVSPEEKVAGIMAKVGKKFFALPILNRVQDPARWIFYKMIRRSDYYQAGEMMRETMKRVIAQDLTALLSHIKAKTLIIWGSQDDYVPVKDAYFMHERIKNSEINVIKGANHYLPKKYPEAVAKYIKEFLQ